MKRAIIIGVTGQDGAYLSKFLLSKKYLVFGTLRQKNYPGSLVNIKKLGIEKEVNLIILNNYSYNNIYKIIEDYKPDEIYNLSGITSVGLSFNYPLETLESIVSITINLLEAINRIGRNIRFYSAGSGEVFGNTGEVPANIHTPHKPVSPYGIAKSTNFRFVEHYRSVYKLYLCTGILFNHESPLRGKQFVTQKIVTTARNISNGSESKLVLGNLDIYRDWGWAPEYVEAMWLMLQSDNPRDYIISTGRTTSLRDFVRITFQHYGLDWQQFTSIDTSLFRPIEIIRSVGDPSEALSNLSWSPKIQIEEIVQNMCDELL